MSKAQHARRKGEPTRMVELVTLAYTKELPMDPIQIKVQSNIFDLDSREDVTVVKVGTFEPVENAQQALARIGNDSAKFLEIINSGLKQHAVEQLRESDTPWSTYDDDGAVVPFSGTPISEEKGKQLAANVLNMAKMLFNYSKSMDRDAKREAKDKAQEMLLSQPAVIEALKASK